MLDQSPFEMTVQSRKRKSANMKPKIYSLFFIALLVLSGCATANKRPPIQNAVHVELERFMGPWYVIANIPTFLEKNAYNAVESYALNKDGSIATTFMFNKGGFSGKKKKYTPRGFVRDKKSNAVWGMRFIWPFKGDYRIVYLDKDYNLTVIGREKRDYVWIMARKPVIPEKDYQRMVDLVASQGYDVSKIRKVPQQARA